MRDGSKGLEKEQSRWWPWLALAIAAGHLAFAVEVRGLRPEHLVLDLGFVALAWIGPRTQRFSLACLPFWLAAMAYDGQGVLHGLRGHVHIRQLYAAELIWFGADWGHGRQILSDYFLSWTSPVLDLLCGFAYMAYLYEPLLLFAYLFRRRPELASRLAWGFLVLNLIGIVTYVIYPAAPPWYVQQYGLGPARMNVPASAAGAARFDAMLGISYFATFYGRNPNVFGAMPSLHAAYPALVFCTVLGLGSAWVTGAGLFALLVAFAAVYLRHHFVFDVLFGWLFAGLAFAAVTGVARSIQGGRGRFGASRLPAPRPCLGELEPVVGR